MSTAPIIPGGLPGGDMPVTTPTFAGTGVPAATAAGATPPAPADAVKAMTQRIMQTLAQNAQRKQFAGTPVPSQVPGMRDPNEARNIGMNTANPRAWGGQRLMAGIQTSIQNAVAQKKDRDLRKAEADWTYMGSALNELYAAQASGNPQAVAEAQSKVDVVLGDPKKLKNLAKALNQDWLDPQKTTVYGEALKKVTAKTEQESQQKHQAAQGIKGLFQKLLQRQQQPQLTPEQRQAIGREIAAKAPTSPVGMGVKEQAEAAKAVLDLEKASKESREQYSFMASADGAVWAINKSNPKDAFRLQDASGKEMTAASKGKNGPMMVNGVPVGVYRNGKPLTPDSPEWTKADGELFNRSLDSVREKTQLKINPIIADQIGPAPKPENYELGVGDAAYLKDLKAYGRRAEEIQTRMKVTATGGSPTGAKLIAQAIREGKQPPTMTGLYKEGVLVREELAKSGFNLAQAESDWKAVQKHLATLNGPQQERLRQAVAFTYESLDNIEDLYNQWQKTKLPGGFEDYNKAALLAAEKLPGEAGSIAHRLNAAINDLTSELGTVYKGGNASTDETLRLAKENLKAEWNDKTFRDSLGQVRIGLRYRKNSMDNSTPAGVSAGSPYTPKTETGGSSDMETQTYNGATYQRKKGTKDQWTLVPANK